MKKTLKKRNPESKANKHDEKLKQVEGKVSMKKIAKKKRDREQGGDNDISKAAKISAEGNSSKVAKETKNKKLVKKRKSDEKTDALVDNFDQLSADVEDSHQEQKGAKEKKNNKLRKKKISEDKKDVEGAKFIQHVANTGHGLQERNGESKKAKKKKTKNPPLILADEKIPEKEKEAVQDEVYHMSSGDADCSKGLKKWVTEYHESRPGLKVLQQKIDDFMTAHEERLEEERKERESKAAEGGWTVVVHHKGRKKTTDSESGITVGSVAQAAVEDKMGKKKKKDVGIDFYRFQKREAHRNEILTLQSKFEQDKKRIQELRAARKFRPY